MQCKKPKFVPVKKELIKELEALKFQCTNTGNGCEKVLIYQEIVLGTHDMQCKYQVGSGEV